MILQRTLILLVFTSLVVALTPLHAQEEETSQTPANGYSADFAYIRDFIRFQAYQGVLKGSSATEAEGAGNSLDKAVLLFNRLRARGFRPVLAYGKLRGENLKKAIAFSLGVTWEDSETTPTINPAANDYLSMILEDHYWVQLPLAEEKWFNLDPSFPGILPGESIAGFRKQLARIPAHLYQRFEVIISADFSIGTQRARTRLLRFIAPTKDIISQPLVLMFLNRELDGTFKTSEKSRFYPVLSVNGKIQPALNLKVEANRIGHRSGGVVPPIKMHTIWIDYSLKMPGSPEQSAQRVLFSERDPEASRLDEMTVISLFNDFKDIEPSVENYEESLRQYARIADQFTKPAITSVLSERELNAITELVAVQQELCKTSGVILNSYIHSAGKCIETTLSTFSLNASPRALAFSIDPVRDTFAADILLFNSRSAAISESDLSSAASSFLSGIAATVLEGSLMRQLTGTPGNIEISGSSDHVLDAISLTQRHASTGVRWTAIDANTAYRLDSFQFSSDMARRLENAIDNAKIVFLPQAGSLPSSNENLVWWEMDAETGTAIGMIGSGIGGAIMKKKQEEQEWARIAGTYQPILTDDWSKRLSDLCLAAADALRNGPDYWKKTEESTLHQAVSMVYEIIYETILNEREIEISSALREFFSPSGRMIMNGTLKMLCRSTAADVVN